MFLVRVTNHEFGPREVEYRIEATFPHTAAARALKKALKEKVFGRRRLVEWNIKIIKL